MSEPNTRDMWIADVICGSVEKRLVAQRLAAYREECEAPLLQRINELEDAENKAAEMEAEVHRLTYVLADETAELREKLKESEESREAVERERDEAGETASRHGVLADDRAHEIERLEERIAELELALQNERIAYAQMATRLAVGRRPYEGI